ncbi:AAA domain-containing protein, putative AbiEii toxin, Type IV TA system [Cetobacterium ceti]|uniref:AAA domain-containing protein, putative AbiEii toxin, Type IV TA system n=1 Tax=Cetobacterium ceti TaxID=180163 RepID=A0A1T4QP87_9FUSO|nr:AAA family ATPase [Cetobacterium ceti]SKA05281.1 AAA domain-containing protein, putative AbiEii toxin, Type IV TA system [Cetobacterium ceti]
MQLKQLYISSFKNLENININFNNKTINSFVGKNGIGKSNILEAIIEIFLFLLERGKIIDFSFKIEYKKYDKEIKIEYNKNKNELKMSYKEDGKFKNSQIVEEIKIGDLPETIVLYYAGQNERLKNYVLEYEKVYLGKSGVNFTKKENPDIRNIFGLTTIHKNISMLLLLVYKNHFTKEILKRLEISEEFIEGKLILKKPYKYSGKTPAMSKYDEERFWKVRGKIRKCLDILAEGNTGDNKNGKEGFFEKEEKYYITLQRNILEKLSEEFSIQELFFIFDDMRIIELFDCLKLKIKKSTNKLIDFNNLSEGENQSLLISTIIEIFNNKECLFLFDEPDAFLHPEWQIKFIQQLQSQKTNNHIIKSTHNLSTIIYLKDEILLCYQNNNELEVKKSDHNLIIQELSSNLINLSKDDIVTSLKYRFEIENKSIVLVEGKTDCIIIEEAWKKVMNKDMPFKLIPVGGHEIIQRILMDNTLILENNENKLIGIFDFDDAYNSWNKLKNQKNFDNFEVDYRKCLTIRNKNMFSLLLPVPKNKDIESLVLSDNNKTFEGDSKLSIELLFYSLDKEVDKYFQDKKSVGGKYKYFSGKKMEFATKIVPFLDKDKFKYFEPLLIKLEKIIYCDEYKN